MEKEIFFENDQNDNNDDWVEDVNDPYQYQFEDQDWNCTLNSTCHHGGDKNDMKMNELSDTVYPTKLFITMDMLEKYNTDPKINKNKSRKKIKEEFQTIVSNEMTKNVEKLIREKTYQEKSISDILLYTPRDIQLVYDFISNDDINGLSKLLNLDILPLQHLIRDMDGNTPLMFAALSGNTKIFDMLWQWGGGEEEYIVNNFGTNVSTMVKENNNFNYYKYQHFFETSDDFINIIISGCIIDVNSNLYNYFTKNELCDKNLLVEIFSLLNLKKHKKNKHKNKGFYNIDIK